MIVLHVLGWWTAVSFALTGVGLALRWWNS
jgi:hypothetical protein